MNDRNSPDRDHWENLALAMELTIEGQRLIAQDLAYEAKALGRRVVGWFRQGALTIRRTAW